MLVDGKWYGNALRFATREEAMAQVSDLAYRWTSVRDMRVVESDDPVNYAYVDHKLRACNDPCRTDLFAKQHGLDSEPDHEVGDLQQFLRLAWSLR